MLFYLNKFLPLFYNNQKNKYDEPIYITSVTLCL